MLHEEILEIDALHLDEITKLQLSKLLCLLTQRLDLHLSGFFLSSDLQLVVHILDRVPGLERHLLQLIIKRCPKLLSEDHAIIEGITCGVLHLFFEDAIELLNGVVDDLLLLALELLLQLNCELVSSCCSPFRLVCDVLDVVRKVLESLRLEFLDFFEVFVLAEDLACSLEELSEAIISYDVGLLQETFLDLIIEFLLKLVPCLVDFLNDVSDCLAIVVLEHLADDCCDISSELQIERPLTLLDLISELISMDLVSLAFDLLAPHARKQHFFLRQVDILILLYGSPYILHELREISDWYIVIDQLFVIGAIDQELFKAFDTTVPILLLPLLQFRRHEEHLQLEHIR